MASGLAVVVLALVVVLAFGADENVWGPADGVKALDAVSKAVDAIVAAPHLSAQHLTQAKQVALDVKKDVEEVESNKTLSKDERNAKVGAAVKELMGLKEEFSRPTSQTEVKSKLATLQKELSEKKEALEKDEAMINLLNLQKALAEKKMELQKLMEKKNASQNSKSAQAQEAGEETLLLGKLSAIASELATNTSKDLSAPAKTAVADLKARENNVTASLAKLEAIDKKSEALLDAAAKRNIPSTGKDDPIRKEQSMLRVLKKEEHRKIMKAEVLKKEEISELKQAEVSIEKRDVQGLKKTLAKMQGEARVLAAKSGNFLH